MRSRWPAGRWGAFSYFIDHVIYRFQEPVDWIGMAAAEEGIFLPTDNAIARPQTNAERNDPRKGQSRYAYSAGIWAFVVLGVCAFAYLSIDGYRATHEHLREQAVSYAHLIAAHDQEDFLLADSLLKTMVDTLSCTDLTGTLSTARHEELRAALLRYRQRFPSVASFSVMGADGLRRVGIVGNDGVNLTGRAYFKALKAGQDFFISNVEDGLSSGKTGIHVTRRVSGPDGRFCGVVELNLGAREVFYNFYQSLRLGSGFETSLRDRRRVLIRFPQGENDSAVFTQEEPLPIEEGRANGVLSVSGKLIAYERLGQSQIYATVSVPESEVLRRHTFSLVVALGGVLALVVCAVLAVRDRRLAAELNRARETAESALAMKRQVIGKISETLEIERKRIASEIHDTLNANIIQIKLAARSIASISDGLTCEQSVAAKTQAEYIVAVAQEMYGSGRSLVRNLRPESIDVVGVKLAIEEMVRNMNQAHPSCTFEMQAPSDLRVSAPQISIAAYRIVQEALSNAVKHANATKVIVKLEIVSLGRPVLRVHVNDDGQGFDSTQPRDGFGLTSMGERVESLGGKLYILSETGAGCFVSVDLPLPSDAA